MTNSRTFHFDFSPWGWMLDDHDNVILWGGGAYPPLAGRIPIWNQDQPTRYLYVPITPRFNDRQGVVERIRRRKSAP